jgi:hypothetical protein
MKSAGPFYVYKRRDTKKYFITLYPASGLPAEICENWQRRGFSRLPLELAVFREPKTKAAATEGAMALIEYLKNQLNGPENTPKDVLRAAKRPRGPTVGAWLKRFTGLDDNPRAARLIAGGSPNVPAFFPRLPVLVRRPAGHPAYHENFVDG